jgi:hypothetical protein
VRTHVPPEFELPAARLAAQRRLLVGAVAAQPRSRVPRRAAVIGVALAVVAALVATPAFGIGSRILDALLPSSPPSPTEAEQQTGTPARTHLRTDYDGYDYSVVTYQDGQGRLCVGEHVGSSAEGNGLGYGCEQPPALFADGPVALLGPGSMQEPDRPGFDPTNWDRMWFDGLTKPGVARLDVVMTDCSTRAVPFDPDSFDGYGVFLYTVPHSDLHAGVWPYQLLSYDRNGRLLLRQAIQTEVPATRQSKTARARPPRPLAGCR